LRLYAGGPHTIAAGTVATVAAIQRDAVSDTSLPGAGLAQTYRTEPVAVYYRSSTGMCGLLQSSIPSSSKITAFYT